MPPRSVRALPWPKAAEEQTPRENVSQLSWKEKNSSQDLNPKAFQCRTDTWGTTVWSRVKPGQRGPHKTPSCSDQGKHVQSRSSMQLAEISRWTRHTVTAGQMHPEPAAVCGHEPSLP